MNSYTSMPRAAMLAWLTGCSATPLDDYSGAVLAEGELRTAPRDAAPAAPRVTDAAAPKPSTGGGLEPSTVKVMKAFQAEFSRQAALTCGCFAPLGFESKAQCLDAQMKVALVGNRCAENALAADEKVSRAFFTCATDAARAINACLQEERECSAMTARAFEACSMGYAEEFAACGELQTGIADALPRCHVLQTESP